MNLLYSSLKLAWCEPVISTKNHYNDLAFLPLLARNWDFCIAFSLNSLVLEINLLYSSHKVENNRCDLPLLN